MARESSLSAYPESLIILGFQLLTWNYIIQKTSIQIAPIYIYIYIIFGMNKNPPKRPKIKKQDLS